MAKNWRTIASWILRFTKIGWCVHDNGQKRSDILGKCAAYSSDSTVSTNPFWLVSQFYRSILLVFFITMAVLWLFCPEIGRVCIFSSPFDGRCHSQLKLEFQGFPGVEWVVSPLSVPSFFCAFTSMALQGNASVPTSQHHCIGGTTQRSSYTFVVQGQKSTIDLQSVTDTIKLWALTNLV